MKAKTALTKRQRGFTLLEYCAGAAAVMIVLFGTMRTFGNNVQTFMGQIGTRLASEGTAINSTSNAAK